MADVKFIAAPRAVVNEIVSEMEGWKSLGQKMVTAAKAKCPVSQPGDGSAGGGLRDSLVVQFISGADPRILVGSKTQGELLGWVTNGTDPHPIDPVNAQVLAFNSGGVTVFAQHVDHPGTKANPFLMDAIKSVAQGV